MLAPTPSFLVSSLLARTSAARGTSEYAAPVLRRNSGRADFWRAALFGLAALSGSAGCSGGDGRDADPISPTLVGVSPSSFLGRVPCADTLGAMQRYVLTLTDLTPGGEFEQFVLPSVGPISCFQVAASALVVPGHSYAARVDGFSRTDIEPLAPGSPAMVDAATGEVVPPRWSTTCGDSDDSRVTSVSFKTRLVEPCAPLTDAEPASSGITVNVDVGLSSRECGTDPGQLARFEVTLDRTRETIEIQCGQRADFTNLDAGKTFQLEVRGFEANADAASFTTVCEAATVPGSLVPASCDPLQATGSVAINLAASFTAAGLDCEDATRVRLSSRSASLTLQRNEGLCDTSLTLDGIAAGSRAVTIFAEFMDTPQRAIANCSMSVAPGELSTASCEPAF